MRGLGMRSVRAMVTVLGALGLASLPTAEARAEKPAGAAVGAGPRAWNPPPVRSVPPPPPPPESRTRMNCVGCAIAGGIVLGAGGAHALVGAIELSDPSRDEEDRAHVLLALAGIHGLVGIPLLVAGLWPVEGTGARAAGAVRLDVGASRAAVLVTF